MSTISEAIAKTVKKKSVEDVFDNAPTIDIDAEPENENWLRIVRRNRLKKAGHKVDPVYGVPLDRDLGDTKVNSN